ncbi:oligosaccharide flippase family protein [Evtepia sp.]|uniref:putative polysaccharide biosynthesis protein n=1 Tax=Evtepia sp. TaxID=2773933 RepID=UPI00284B8833|nr:polysaccharide biosynthesis protein [Evtepia sp.]
MKKRALTTNTFFGGAAILAASIAVVKVIGALYKIPLGRILGDVGFGHFNNAYAIYNLLLMISQAGLPVAMSKTISEANALGRRNQVSRVFRVALTAFLVLGIASSLIMFLFAQPLANLQGDSLAAPAVRVMALSCFFVCVMSAYRGYAQGHSDMVPTAVSQVLEALTKLIVGLFLAWYLLYLGFGSEISAAGAIGGVTASGLVALLYLMVRHHRRNSPRSLPPATDKPEGSGKILKTLVVIAIPITLSSSVVPITTYLDTIQVQNLLQSALGYAEELAVSLYGCYQKAVTIYNLPSAFMVSLTACIVPAVSAALTKKDKVGAGKIAESALRVGAMLALPAGIGLTVLAGPIIQLLYPETNQEVGTQCLMVLGIASIFVCIMLLCNAILQANGRTALPIWFIAIGSAIKLGVNFVLVQMPSVGIKGAPVGTLVCFGVVSVLELAAIKRVTPHPPKYLRVFGKAAVAAVLMGAAAWASYGLLSGHFGNTLSVAGAILVGCVVYVILVVALRVVSKDDLSLMPKGEKIAKLLRIR